MKDFIRIISLLLSALMLLSAVSCDTADKSNTNTDTVSADNAAISESASTETEAQTETEPEITEAPVIKAESVSISVPGEGDPVEGETRELNITVSPEGVMVLEYDITFSEFGIIELDSNGNIHFIAPGKVTMTVTHADGVSASIDFNVLAATVEAENISLSASALEIETGNTEQLTAVISPDNTTDRTIIWTSSDSSVATVEEGKITAVKAGQATITAATANGKSAVCSVNVRDKEIPVTAIQPECLVLNMTVGESHRFAVALVPSDTTMKTVKVSSSDTSVLSTDGLTFTANKAGNAVVTITSSNGISVQVSVNVAEKEAEKTISSETSAQTETNTQTSVIEEDMSLPQCDFPRVNGKVACASNRYYCISGTTAENSTVHAYITITAKDGSQSTKQMDVTPQGKRFFFMFRISRGQSAKIDLTATAEGMRTSKTCSTSITMEASSSSSTGVSVGENSWLHLSSTEDDFRGKNLFSQDDLATIEKSVFKTLETLRKRSGRDDIKAIFLIAPNNATIYPENAPAEWKESKQGDNSRMKQVIELSKTWDEEDIIFIDLYDYLVEQKSIGHIYYQTDTHWNKVGAYFGYYKLMSAIAVDFPEAKPHELSDFTMSTITYTGDMSSWLGFDSKAGSETTLTLTPNFTTAVVSREGGEYGTNGVITTKVDNENLPTAVVQRDSFATALHSLLAEHFSTLVYTTFGADRSEAYKVAEEISPDYFIRVTVERNLHSNILN